MSSQKIIKIISSTSLLGWLNRRQAEKREATRMTEEDVVDHTYSFDEDGDSEGGNYHYSNNNSHGKRRKPAPPSSTLSVAEQQRAIEIQEQEAIRRHRKNTIWISITAALVVVGILILSILLTRENNDGNDDKNLSPSPTDIPAPPSITVQPSSSPSTSEPSPETSMFDTPSQEECLAIAEGDGSLNHNIEENSTLLTYGFLLELDMYFPINTTIVTSELQQDLLTNLQTTAAPIIAGCPSNNEDDDPIIIRRRRLRQKSRILIDALNRIVNVVFQDMQIKNPTSADQQCTEEIDEAACIPIVVNVLVSVVWWDDDESETTEHLSVDVEARFREAVEAINDDDDDDDATVQEIKFVNLQGTGIVATPPIDEDVPTMSPTTKPNGASTATPIQQPITTPTPTPIPTPVPSTSSPSTIPPSNMGFEDPTTSSPSEQQQIQPSPSPTTGDSNSPPPTQEPSQKATSNNPTDVPSPRPSSFPTVSPIERPSTKVPTQAPTTLPPTKSPTPSPNDTIQTSPPSQSISGSCGGVATPCESLMSISDCMHNPDTALDTCDDFMNICRPLCDDQVTYCECQQNDVGCEHFGVSSHQICHASIDCVGSIPSCTTFSTEEDCLSAIGCEWSVPIPTIEPTDRPTPFPTKEPTSPSSTLPPTSNPAATPTIMPTQYPTPSSGGGQWGQEATLVADDDDDDDDNSFGGGTVSISGNTAVVGSRYTAESAYIFNKDIGGSWTMHAKLTGDTEGEGFGQAVDVDGDTVVVGAIISGVVYIFSASTGMQELKIMPPVSGSFVHIEVAVSGSTVIVARRGANIDDNVIFYDIDDDSVQTQSFSFPWPSAGSGDCVAIDSNTAVVGAPWLEQQYDDHAFAGGAFVFERIGSQWTQQEELRAITFDHFYTGFGEDCAVKGGTIVVGAPEFNEGRVYVYERDNGSWPIKSVLTSEGSAPTGSDSNEEFGGSVSVDGDLIVAGASKEHHSTGRAYVFQRSSESGWGHWSTNQVAQLTSNNPELGGSFGRSIDISGHTVVIGGGIGRPAYIFNSFVPSSAPVTLPPATPQPTDCRGDFQVCGGSSGIDCCDGYYCDYPLFGGLPRCKPL